MATKLKQYSIDAFFKMTKDIKHLQKKQHKKKINEITNRNNNTEQIDVISLLSDEEDESTPIKRQSPSRKRPSKKFKPNPIDTTKLLKYEMNDIVTSDEDKSSQESYVDTIDFEPNAKSSCTNNKNGNPSYGNNINVGNNKQYSIDADLETAVSSINTKLLDKENITLNTDSNLNSVNINFDNSTESLSTFNKKEIFDEEKSHSNSKTDATFDVQKILQESNNVTFKINGEIQNSESLLFNLNGSKIEQKIQNDNLNLVPLKKNFRKSLSLSCRQNATDTIQSSSNVLEQSEDNYLSNVDKSEFSLSYQQMNMRSGISDESCVDKSLSKDIINVSQLCKQNEADALRSANISEQLAVKCLSHENKVKISLCCKQMNPEVNAFQSTANTSEQRAFESNYLSNEDKLKINTGANANQQSLPLFDEGQTSTNIKYVTKVDDIKLAVDGLEEFIGISGLQRRPTVIIDGHMSHLYESKGFEEVEKPKISVRNDLFNSKSELEDPETVQQTVDRVMPDYHVRYTKLILNEVLNHEQHKLLFTNKQIEIYNNLLSLDDAACKLCIRLFYRNHVWQRFDSLLKDSHLNFNLTTEKAHEIYENIKRLNLIVTDYESEDLVVLLNLLQSKELKDIMDFFKLKCSPMKREVMIERLIENTKKQKTIFGQTSKLADILKKQVLAKLGKCIRLHDDFRHFLFRSQLLYAITEHLRPQDLYFQMSQKFYGLSDEQMKIKIDAPKIFESEEEFSEYEHWRYKYNDFMEFLEKKDQERALVSILLACKKLTSILKTPVQRKEPSFLNRFSVANCIVGIISEGITLLKQEISDKRKKKGPTTPLQSLINKSIQELFQAVQLNADHVCSILDLLLQQTFCKLHRRAQWLKEKMILLKKYKKDFNQAIEFLLQAVRSEEFKKCELIQLYLYDESKHIIKLRSISDDQKKILLDFIKTSSVPKENQFPIQNVNAIEMPGTKSGSRKLYKLGDGESYPNVEEVAKDYYVNFNNIKFEQGLHAEGRPIYALYDILFWDIIYEYYVPNTFISALQSVPLDLFSQYFYENRKPVIDERLLEIENASFEDLKKRIEMTINSRSLETVDKMYDVKLLSTIVNCLDRKVLIGILQRLIHNYGTYKAGFPDLIMWNTNKKLCKFVEVKGDGDSLRPKQILWIAYLLNIGADVEVCYVRSGNKTKRIGYNPELDAIASTSSVVT